MHKQFLLILLILSAIAAQGQWVQLPENFDGNSISTIKNIGGTLFVSAQEYGTRISTIYRSTDSGLNWTRLDTSSGYRYGWHTQFITLGRNIFVTDHDSGIYRSIDAGNTWQRVFHDKDARYQSMAISGSVIFLGNDLGRIYQSSDSGSIWSYVKSTPCNYVYEMAANSTHVFAAHCTGLIILNTNGKWSAPSSGIKSQSNQSDGVDAIVCKGSFVFAGFRSEIYRSSDNGANWDTIGMRPGTTHCFGVSNANLLISAKAGVYATGDNGLNWVFAGSGLGGRQVNGFDSLGRYMFAVARDGVYRIDTSQIAKAIPNKPVNKAAIPVFPNPFSDHIDISGLGNEETELIIVDMFSRPVLQITFTQAVSLSTGHLTSGMYYYELRSKNGIIQNGKVFKP